MLLLQSQFGHSEWFILCMEKLLPMWIELHIREKAVAGPFRVTRYKTLTTGNHISCFGLWFLSFFPEGYLVISLSILHSDMPWIYGSSDLLLTFTSLTKVLTLFKVCLVTRSTVSLLCYHVAQLFLPTTHITRQKRPSCWNPFQPDQTKNFCARMLQLCLNRSRLVLQLWTSAQRSF